MNGKIALVTGASSGIGRNASISLSKAGFVVVGTARNLSGLEETADQCAGKMHCIGAGVTADELAPFVAEHAPVRPPVVLALRGPLKVNANSSKDVLLG
ncbi:MAG: SDR family NAD(P)-dependent oxidoreductase [Pseudomonadota bacterium]